MKGTLLLQRLIESSKYQVMLMGCPLFFMVQFKLILINGKEKAFTHF